MSNEGKRRDGELFDAGKREPEREKSRVEGNGCGTARVKEVNRRQMMLRAVDVEKLVGEEHPVRAIWEFVGAMDLGPYYKEIEAVEGEAGRPAFDPRLMISIWIYAYSEGISSAREIERLCEYHPGYQWLTGMEVINHHTLSDFRVGHKKALDELFEQGLGLLSAEGLIRVERVMQDGTKIKACAGVDTLRREEKIRAHLEMARKQVEEMGDPRSQETSQRMARARERGAREKKERLELALKELEKIRATQVGKKAKKQARVSETDPEARMMKQGNGGYAPSYNVQVSTDAANKIILAVAVSQQASDYEELAPAADRVTEKVGKPDQMVADGGFTSRGNIIAMEKEGIDFYGPIADREGQSIGQLNRQGVDPAFRPDAFRYDPTGDTYRCPAGKTLKYESKERRTGVTNYKYRARVTDCQRCALKPRCCPKNGTKGRSIVRAVEDPVVVDFHQKMETEQAKEIYKQRGPVAEFPNLWIKDKLGLRQFRLRGVAKVGLEALWACLTYNIQQWIRLCWRPRRAESHA